jgi:hypothetical protein
VTNVQIYLAGARSAGDNPYEWHERAQEYVQAPVEAVNPFTIHDDDAGEVEYYIGDLDAIEEADALLVRRAPEVETCGAYIEAGWAGRGNTPVVTWNDGDGEIPDFLKWHSIHYSDDLEEIVEFACSLAMDVTMLGDERRLEDQLEEVLQDVHREGQYTYEDAVSNNAGDYLQGRGAGMKTAVKKIVRELELNVDLG